MGQSSVKSSFGKYPNKNGLEKFIRDKHVANNINPWKQLIHAQHNTQSQALKIFIHILTPTLLVVGLLGSLFALYYAINETDKYGLQSILVDTTVSPTTLPAGSSNYQISASETKKLQIYSLRGGEWGRNQNITLTLPHANLMETNSVIYVRNAGIEILTSTNSVNPATPVVTVISGTQGSINLNARQNYTFINSASLNGGSKWYNALLMDGV